LPRRTIQPNPKGAADYSPAPPTDKKRSYMSIAVQPKERIQTMKIKTRTTVLLIAISLGGVLLAVTSYASVINVLALGTIPDSQLFGGPATVTVRTLTIRPG